MNLGADLFGCPLKSPRLLVGERNMRWHEKERNGMWKQTKKLKMTQAYCLELAVWIPVKMLSLKLPFHSK